MRSLEEPLLLAPQFENVDTLSAFLRIAKELADADTPESREGILRGVFDTFLTRERKLFEAAASVLADLLNHGWAASVQSAGIMVSLPEQAADRTEEKQRLRSLENIKRDEQLRRPATRRFIHLMESRRVYEGHTRSIADLMRDGPSLADALRKVDTQSTASLRHVIDPYLVIVRPSARCPYTGFLLSDIWRYFRHTWSTQSTSIPGRSMALLVRDAAATCHPIIGLAALSSPVIQLKARDEWIGWDSDSFLDFLASEGSGTHARWARSVVSQSLDEVFHDDFVEDQVLTPHDLDSPTSDIVARLRQLSSAEREKHLRFGSNREFKSKRVREADEQWSTRAASHLFRSKRAKSLADLLEIRMALEQFLPNNQPDELRHMAGDRLGKRALRRVIRIARSLSVGISMADLTVCGAVPPYSHLTGGKLLALLAISPETTAEYRQRYGHSESEIASSMAGKGVVRSPNLVYVGTTSLYATGSSQYNRLYIPAGRLGGPADLTLRYEPLGESASYGTSQFSKRSIDALVEVSEMQDGGRRVKSIFGEGVSPKMRKVREGLAAVGLPSNELLQHGRPRLVYGVPLIENLRDFLLGMDRKPRYLVDPNMGAEGSRAIVDWWLERWASNRAQSKEVLLAIRMHYGAHHGARVKLPPNEVELL